MNGHGRTRSEVPRHWRAALPLVAAAVALTWAPLGAQSGAALMERAMERQAERLKGVENLTLTQDAMGTTMTVYMEKREMGGVPALVPVSVTAMGQTTKIPQDQAIADWSNPFQEEWAARTRLVGDDEVDGHPVKVLLIDDFSGLEIPGLPGQQAGEYQDWQPTSMRFYLDEDELLMRKMELKAEMRREGEQPAPIEVTMYLEDFREVDGYVHPFRTRVSTKGMMEAANVDQEELRRQLEEMKKQLANMPEAQRTMVEGMMKAQMERMESMLGEGGAMETTITVTSLKVNAGPPGGGGVAGFCLMPGA